MGKKKGTAPVVEAPVVEAPAVEAPAAEDDPDVIDVADIARVKAAIGENRTVFVKVAQVKAMPQVRKHFDPIKLQELADNIKTHGLLQAIVVNFIDGGLEIIAGERRWRAVQMAGATKIEAKIREISRRDAIEIQTIENLQREDLSATEEAAAFKTLMDECNYTQEQLAERLNKSQGYISEKLGLLGLPEVMHPAINDGRISTRAAMSIRRILPEDGSAPGRVAVIVAKELVDAEVPAAKAVGWVKERVRNLAYTLDPAAPQYTGKLAPIFAVSGCTGCPYRMEGKIVDYERPLCLHSPCWEAKQLAAERAEARRELLEEREEERQEQEEELRNGRLRVAKAAKLVGSVLQPVRALGLEVPSNVAVALMASRLTKAAQDMLQAQGEGAVASAVAAYRTLCAGLGISDKPDDLVEALHLPKSTAAHKVSLETMAQQLARFHVQKATGTWPETVQIPDLATVAAAAPQTSAPAPTPAAQTAPQAPAPQASTSQAPASQGSTSQAPAPQASAPQAPPAPPAPAPKKAFKQKAALTVTPEQAAVAKRLKAQGVAVWEKWFSDDLKKIKNPEETVLFDLESLVSLEDLITHFSDRYGVGATQMPAQFGGGGAYYDTNKVSVAIPLEDSYWDGGEVAAGLLAIVGNRVEVRLKEGRNINGLPVSPLYFRTLAHYSGSNGEVTIYQVAVIAFPTRDVVIHSKPKATCAKALHKSWINAAALLPAFPELPAEKQEAPEAPATVVEEAPAPVVEEAPATVVEEAPAPVEGDAPVVEEAPATVEGDAPMAEEADRTEALAGIGSCLAQLVAKVDAEQGEGGGNTAAPAPQGLTEAELRKELTSYWTTRGVIEVMVEVLKRNDMPKSGTRAAVQTRIENFLRSCTVETLLAVYEQGGYSRERFPFKPGFAVAPIAV